MSTIFDVAEYILGKFPYGISTKKLQKLVFFAQGWVLVFLDRPLFQEDFQAWARGPVSPTLYEAHRGEFVVEKGAFPQGVSHRLTFEERLCIDAVIQNYGALTGMQLEELTSFHYQIMCGPGASYEDTKRFYEEHPTLPKGKLKQCFKRILDT